MTSPSPASANNSPPPRLLRPRQAAPTRPPPPTPLRDFHRLLLRLIFRDRRDPYHSRHRLPHRFLRDKIIGEGTMLRHCDPLHRHRQLHHPPFTEYDTPRNHCGYQIAHGVLAEVDRHPFDLNQILLMDWSDAHLNNHLHLRSHNTASTTVLYAMPFNESLVFLEETSLVSRPVLDYGEVKKRMVVGSQSNDRSSMPEALVGRDFHPVLHYTSTVKPHCFKPFNGQLLIRRHIDSMRHLLRLFKQVPFYTFNNIGCKICGFDWAIVGIAWNCGFCLRKPRELPPIYIQRCRIW